MNILHIDEQTGWRGGEQQAHYLIAGLARHGHWNFLAGRRGSPFLAHGDPNMVRIEAPFAGELDLFTAFKLARAIRNHEIDIIHAHTSHAHTHACLARAIAGRGRVVVSRRVDFEPKRNVFNRWKYRAPDRVVAISERIGEVLRAFGVRPPQLVVVHSAIDPMRFDVSPLPRAELGIPEDVPVLGNVAALVGHKDHATLIAAMPHVLRKIPNLRLVVAGEGELRPAIEAQIAELGVGHAVTLLGYRKDVPHILRALDAFVLSSKLEGLGTSVLDAMVCGLPVVATAGGGIPEMITHEECGLLAPPQEPEALAEAIVRVFQDPGLADRMGKNARQRVLEHFTVDRMVEGNLRVYESLKQ
ncbi:MAG: glycosyltransferase family 4 protein [FCB group bacterium]|nr:glycosyltransferase family 4 protein [FCB group bacterium]